MKQSGRKEEGFTLVEICIALAIAGIVAMLAVPSITGVMPRLKLNNDTFTLANEIALSRARAIAKNQEFRIIFSTAGDSYTLRNETGGINFAGNTTSKNIDLYLVQNLGAANTLAVRAVGNVGRDDGAGNYEDLPLGTVGRIHLQTIDTAYRKRIVVEATGRVYVERWAGGASWVEE
jgi:prepilin-type N-terminal cleavage/methylation domain-containing protein